MHSKLRGSHLHSLGKLLAGLTCIALLSSSYASVQLRFLPLEGEPGENAEYPVKFVVEGLSEGSALQFDLSWDSNFVSPVTPELNSSLNSHLIDYELIGENELRVIIYSLSNEVINIESILTLNTTFSRVANTEDQPFSISNTLLSSPDSQSVEIAEIPVTFGIPRDAIGSFTIAKDAVALAWPAKNEAVSYQVYRSASEDQALASLHGTPSDPSFADTFVGNAVYFYWIAAKYEDGLSSRSPVLRVAPIPSIPESFIVSDADHPTNISVQWSLYDNPDSLEIYRSIGTSPIGAESIANPDTSLGAYQDETAMPGVPYHYWLKLTNQYGSTFSEVETGLNAIAPEFENTMLVSALENGAVTLHWQSVEGNKYAIAYSNDMRTWTLLLETVTGTGEAMQWSDFENAGVEFPAYFQVFAVVPE